MSACRQEGSFSPPPPPDVPSPAVRGTPLAESLLLACAFRRRSTFVVSPWLPLNLVALAPPACASGLVTAVEGWASLAPA